MSKELEEAKEWINDRLVYIAQNCDLQDTDNKTAYNNLQTILNYIDNSIPKEVVENKLNEQRSKVTNKCMYCNHNCDKYDVCTALQELLEVQNEQ